MSIVYTYIIVRNDWTVKDFGMQGEKMEKEKVIIFGEGNIQEVARFYLENDGKWEVAAFTADREYISADTYLGRPMVPFENIESVYPPA